MIYWFIHYPFSIRHTKPTNYTGTVSVCKFAVCHSDQFPPGQLRNFRQLPIKSLTVEGRAQSSLPAFLCRMTISIQGESPPEIMYCISGLKSACGFVNMGYERPHPFFQSWACWCLSGIRNNLQVVLIATWTSTETPSVFLSLKTTATPPYPKLVGVVVDVQYVMCK